MFVHWLSSLSVLVIAISTNIKKYSNILSLTYDMYSSLPSDSKSITFKFYTVRFIISVLPFTLFFAHLVYIPAPTLYFIIYLLAMNYGYYSLIAVENLISSICLLAEKRFSNIAYELHALKDKRFDGWQFKCLTNLLDEYVRCNKFSCVVSEFFEQYFVVFFFACVSRTILHSLMFLANLKFPGAMGFVQAVFTCLHAIFILARTICLSYRCQQVEDHVSIVVLFVCNLSILLKELSDFCADLYRLYTIF